MDKGVESLILNNLDLVPYVIHRLKFTPDDDLLSEGTIGLIKAAKNFDPNKGTKFHTYAISYIKGYVKDYVTFKTRLIRPVRTLTGLHVIEVPQEDTTKTGEYQSDDEDIEGKLIIEDFLSKLTPDERYLVQALMDGYTQSAVAEQLNLKQPTVSQLLRMVRYKYLTYKHNASNKN